jgi:uncharacterized protein (DUF1778 family)
MRPTRPSAAKPLTPQAAKFTDPQVRLSIRVDKSTLRSIRRSAVLSDKTIKRFVLDALRAQGVEIAEQDANDTTDTE